MPIRDTQNTTQQHAVPQNIMDVEFKLVGDLTMRQFAYIFVFGISAYLVAQNLGGVFRWPIATILGLVGLGLAFVPVQERGLDEWLVNFIKAIYKPTQLIWRKEVVLPSVFTNQNLAVVQQELITLAPTSSRRKLEDYLNSYQDNTVDDPLDIPEKDYIMKVRSAFSTTTTVSPPQDQATSALPPTLPEEEKEEEPLTLGSAPSEREPVNEEKVEVEPEITSMGNAAPVTSAISLRVPSVRPKVSFTSQPITPDRHSGRVFTRLLPKQGEIVLPIRGQKTLKTSEQIEIDEDIGEKAVQLKELLEQIKRTEGVDVEVTSGADKLQEAADITAQELKEKNVRITEEIENIKRQEGKSEEVQSRLSQLEEKRSVTVEEYEALQKQLLNLQEKVEDKKASVIELNTPVAKKPTMSDIKPITSAPNIISGIVKDNTGNILQGVVLIVKNNKGEPVRALKSDSTGQFALSTPLGPGLYTVEVGPSNTLALSFDIISVEVDNSVLPPIELTGKK